MSVCYVRLNRHASVSVIIIEDRAYGRLLVDTMAKKSEVQDNCVLVFAVVERSDYVRLGESPNQLVTE